MHTAYADDQFDAVISNRLFHHFNTSELRRPAIAELARISSGPVIISFFNSFALSAQWRQIKRRIKGVTPKDRIPIPRSLLEADLESQGLKAIDWHATRWGISPHWYVVAAKI
jgi:SAM-dependent methyltransferase